LELFERLFNNEPSLFVTKTVLLELFWVFAVLRCRDGLEFPDALHLAASGACSAFLTFDDRNFVRRAQRLNLTLTCEIPG